MQGTPEEGMNGLRIVAPNAKGRLFIDHLITATKVDARQQTADLQVPFVVNAGTTNHWLVLYKHSLLKPDIELTPVSDSQWQEMRLLERRFRDMIYTKGKITEKKWKPSARNMISTGLPIRTGKLPECPFSWCVRPKPTSG